MSLTKRDIARTIHRTVPDISISEAVSLVDAIFHAFKDRLADGDKVMITNFGTFQVVQRAPRQGINPATGTGLVIDGHRAVSFRPAPSLLQALSRTGPQNARSDRQDGADERPESLVLDPDKGR